MDKHKAKNHLNMCNDNKKQYQVVFIIVVAFFFLFREMCFGTLMSSTDTLCPVCNDNVTVMSIVSYGSYIYDRESKFDLIYFPYDDPKLGSIYLCHHCGYAQVAKHFFELKSHEKIALKEYLSDKWKPMSSKDITPGIRLDQAIRVNKFLEKDEDFWAWFNRIMIYHYRKTNLEKAKSIASAELELLQKGKGKFENPEKYRTYLLGEYNRLLGNNELAKKYLGQALGVDAISSLKKTNALMILLLLTSFILLLYVLKKLKNSKILKPVYCLSLIVLIALCLIWVYFLPAIIQRQEQLGNYYDGIITERIQLCNEQKQN